MPASENISIARKKAISGRVLARPERSATFSIYLPLTRIDRIAANVPSVISM